MLATTSDKTLKLAKASTTNTHRPAKQTRRLPGAIAGAAEPEAR
jgi:hypothetical protein